MVARELAYNIIVGAARSSGVDQAFNGVNKRIAESRMQLAQTLDRQKELNAEITKARRAGENYQPLQQELDATKTRVDDLNRSIQNQQIAIADNDQRTERWGRRMRWVTAGAVGLSAALIALVQVQGQYSRSLVNAAEITGQTAEQMERMDQAARRLTGQSLSPDAWVGILDSMRQLQHQFRLGTDLTEDQLLAFQRLRVDPYSTAALGAREWYEALLNVAPAQRAIVAAAVPGLNAIYSALRPALEQNQSWNDVLAETVALSDETHERYARTQQRLGDLGRSFRNAGTEASSTFLPVMEDVLDVLVPIIRGFAKFAEQNPGVIRALAAIGIGLGAVTIALWLANTAATFFAAVTGVGIPLIAVAAAAAGAVAIAGGVGFALSLSGSSGDEAASSAEQQEAAQAEAEERQRANDNANSDKVAGAVTDAAVLNKAIFERSRQDLDPILRTLACLEEAHADEPTPASPETVTPPQVAPEPNVINAAADAANAIDAVADVGAKAIVDVGKAAIGSVASTIGDVGAARVTTPAGIAAVAINAIAPVADVVADAGVDAGLTTIDAAGATANAIDAAADAAADKIVGAGAAVIGFFRSDQPDQPRLTQGVAAPPPGAFQVATAPTTPEQPRAVRSEPPEFTTTYQSPQSKNAPVFNEPIFHETAVIRPEVEPTTIPSPQEDDDRFLDQLRNLFDNFTNFGRPDRQDAPVPALAPESTSAPQSTQATVNNYFYDTPDPAGEIVRETETAITRVNTRR